MLLFVTQLDVLHLLSSLKLYGTSLQAFSAASANKNPKKISEWFLFKKRWNPFPRPLRDECPLASSGRRIFLDLLSPQEKSELRQTSYNNAENIFVSNGTFLAHSVLCPHEWICKYLKPCPFLKTEFKLFFAFVSRMSFLLWAVDTYLGIRVFHVLAFFSSFFFFLVLQSWIFAKQKI